MEEYWLLHERLGHPSFFYLKIRGNLDFSKLRCEVCELAKNHQVSYPLRIKRNDIPFSIIHSDVWGPSRIHCLSSAKWFVSFVDDCSKITWNLSLERKSWDNKYTQVVLQNDSSTILCTSKSRVAERKNQHLLEVARASMFARNVPKLFWGDAILTAAYLINKMPSKTLDFDPH